MANNLPKAEIVWPDVYHKAIRYANIIIIMASFACARGWTIMTIIIKVSLRFKPTQHCCDAETATTTSAFIDPVCCVCKVKSAPSAEA